MVAYKKISNSAVVLEVRLSGRIKDSDPPGEGSLDLKVANADNQTLHCFMDNDNASIFYRKTVVVGDEISVLFALGGDYTKALKLREKEKKLTWVEMKDFFSNYYTVKGEVIQITPHPEMQDSNQVILDCGVYVSTRVAKTVFLKVGEYVQMQGRLDAHIVGKVN